MLHLTDIKKYERCPRAFWLSRRKKKEFVPFVNYNESMSELVKQLLMIRDEDVLPGRRMTAVIWHWTPFRQSVC